MVRPRALRAGDRVAIVSPASPFDRAEFDAGVAELRRLGLDPVWDDRVFAREPMVSGPPELRARAFLDALRDPGVAAIVAVRGGYGSVEILPQLDARELRDARKIICGYSDITSLLVYAVCHAGLVAFHGPMLERRLSRGALGYDAASFSAALFRPVAMGELRPDGISVMKTGTAHGMLVGGTLTQLAAGLGTPFGIRLDRPSILFIEDVGERPYKLRRMLVQMQLAGVFDRVTGIVLGTMTGCDESPHGALSACDAIDAFFAGFDGPILSGFPSGHGDAPLWTLPFGVQASISTDDGARLTIEEPAVD
ncbi:MAG: LD-carboxypeptidase [Acidobacteriota bacterium]|nr:LD-carboxypeptidase [Acidobacteriota bacterium]